MKNIEKLQVGMVLKNYKALCELLDIKVKGGESKICQMNDIARFVRLEKQGFKLIVKEVYNEPKYKRGRGGNKKYVDLNKHIPHLLNFMTNDFKNDVSELTIHSNVELEWRCPRCNVKHIRKVRYVSQNNHTKCTKCSGRGKDNEINLITMLNRINNKG